MPNSEFNINNTELDQQYHYGSDWIVMPMMPLRGTLVFPHVVTHLDVGRDRSLNAINDAMEGDANYLFLAMQKDPQLEEPLLGEIYEVGTVVKIRQLLKLPGGTVRLLVEGLYRARRVGIIQEDPYFLAEIEPLHSIQGPDEVEEKALKRLLMNSFSDYAKISKRVTAETMASINNISDPDVLADIISGQLTMDEADRQGLLEILNLTDRMMRIVELIDQEIEIANMEKLIASKVRQQMDKSQREYYLREQMKAIQTELGDGEDRVSEVENYRQKANEAELPENAREVFDSELKKLEKTPPMMAEAMVIANYLDMILALPWNKSSEETKDILYAEQVLDEDHYGLAKPKERIIEYLASCQLKNNLKGPIICLVGPPGVGKTSLARSIARATGRKFVRMSLGGVHDTGTPPHLYWCYAGAHFKRYQNCWSQQPAFPLRRGGQTG